MEQHACTYSVLIHTIDPWGGVNGQNILRSHVAYQVKRNGPYRLCKHILYPYTHTRPLGWSQRSKHFFLLKVVMLHIKLKEIEPRAPCKHIFYPYTLPQPVGWIKGENNSKGGHVAYQIKGKEV